MDPYFNGDARCLMEDDTFISLDEDNVDKYHPLQIPHEESIVEEYFV